MLEDLLVQYVSSKVESNNVSRSLESSAPLLSPTAEAELLLLATNFLLYVAMVIIVTIVCKIYFPDSLKRSENAQNISRSHSYLRVISGDDYVSGDDEEEETTEQEETPPTSPPGFLEFDMANSSRQAVVKRLAFCSMMLICTFVAWGALQERILTRRYPRITGEYFTYSYALVFTNRLWTFVMSGILLLYIKPTMSRSTVIYEYSFPSISNMLSSWCQYEALRYVTFPAATLFKCFKLVPVMVRFNLVVIQFVSYFPPIFFLFFPPIRCLPNFHSRSWAKY